MKPEDVFGLLVPVTFVAMMALEALFPARRFPPRKLWRLVGLGFFLVMGFISTVAPFLLPEAWVAAHRLMDLSALPLPAAIPLGYAVLSLMGYAFHRSCHRVHLF